MFAVDTKKGMAKIDAPAFNKEANKSKDDITLEMSDSKKVLYL